MRKRLSLITILILSTILYVWSTSNKGEIQQTVICSNSSFDLVKTIRQSAKKLTGTKYSQSKKTDCSGMFHKLLDSFRDECPNIILPTINEARSSRNIAKWYHDYGDLKIIRDPKESGFLIKPGMVMFYGYGSQKYNRKKLDINTLIIRGKGTNHVAIVTSVEMKDGVVESYEIFHGRNSKCLAGVTTSRRIYPHRPNTPAYGNGPEPWLAIAEVLVEKKD
ncbi:MAG: hypothetical protein ACI94Y_001248 [Maribacter sp.]|jgi:hypothetical protein